jgi:hypothetical protein
MPKCLSDSLQITIFIYLAVNTNTILYSVIILWVSIQINKYEIVEIGDLVSQINESSMAIKNSFRNKKEKERKRRHACCRGKETRIVT